jgi:O-antigen ligase
MREVVLNRLRRTASGMGRKEVLWAIATVFAGSLAGYVLARGSSKEALLLTGLVFLAYGCVYPRVILWLLVILTVCFSETLYGIEGSSMFRLGSYVLDPFRLNIYELLAYSLFAILMVRRLMHHPRTTPPRSVSLPSVAFACIYISQVALGLMRGNSYPDVVHPWNGQYVLAGVAVLWCFTQLLDTPKMRVRLLDILFALAAGRAAYALTGYFFGNGDVANAYRAVGVKVAIWESADHLLFVLLIVVAIAGWATGRLSKGRSLLWMLASVPMAATVILSFRRTSWAGLLAALVIVVLFLIGRSKRALGLVPVVVAAAGGILTLSYLRFPGTESLVSRLFPDLVAASGASRQEEWALAWKTIARNPLAGDIIARRAAKGLYYWDTRIVHNAILFAWMKFGLLGMLSIGFLALACVRFAFRGVRRRGAEEHIALAVLALAPFAVLLTMTETPLIETRTLLILAIAGSLGVLVGRDETSH